MSLLQTFPSLFQPQKKPTLSRHSLIFCLDYPNLLLPGLVFSVPALELSRPFLLVDSHSNPAGKKLLEKQFEMLTFRSPPKFKPTSAGLPGLSTPGLAVLFSNLSFEMYLTLISFFLLMPSLLVLVSGFHA